MNKKTPFPPRGWNSYQSFMVDVNEEQVKANAAYMAEHLKPYGYEYVVIDISWYADTRDFYLNPEGAPVGNGLEFPITLDEHGRPLPDPLKFPSSKSGNGFRPLADYIHGLGLKFGIHIMRGVPYAALGRGFTIAGTDIPLDNLPEFRNTCSWCNLFVGVKEDSEASALWYDSLIRQYADWGVDFIKCDDIAHPLWLPELQMLTDAIERSDREIMLSLSPGPAFPEHADEYLRASNLFRISTDLWDNWYDITLVFDLLEQWNKYAGKGGWPDADLLPLGHLCEFPSVRGGSNRAIAGSPETSKKPS